jgi:Uma2 family endonuclease
MTTFAARPVTYGLDASYPRFSVARYLRMVRDGNIDDDDKVELLEGYLVLKMSRNPPHDFDSRSAASHGSSLQKLQRCVSRVLPAGWDLRQQLALQLLDSVPEPDLAVVRADSDDYETRHPLASEAGLVVEVAETSLPRDTQDKVRIYARAGIVIYWVIDLVNRQVLVYENPSGAVEIPVYGQTQTYHPGDQVPFVLDGISIAAFAVNDLLPRGGP